MRRLSSIFGVTSVVGVLMAVMGTSAQAASLYLAELPSGVRHAIQVGDFYESLEVVTTTRIITWIGVEVECTHYKESGLIQASNKAKGVVVHKECGVTKGNETCALGSSEIPAEVAMELDGSAYAKLTPFKTALQEAKSEEPPLANVEFEGVEGEECLLITAGESSEVVEITGEEAAKIVDNPGTGTGEAFVFSQAISEASGVPGLFISGGENSAILEGETSKYLVLRGATDMGRLVTH